MQTYPKVAAKVKELFYFFNIKMHFYPTSYSPLICSHRTSISKFVSLHYSIMILEFHKSEPIYYTMSKSGNYCLRAKDGVLVLKPEEFSLLEEKRAAQKLEDFVIRMEVKCWEYKDIIYFNLVKYVS